jgi:hypothetical protein
LTWTLVEEYFRPGSAGSAGDACDAVAGEDAGAVYVDDDEDAFTVPVAPENPPLWLFCIGLNEDE